MRATMAAVTAITLMSSVAVADDIQDAQRQAVAGRDSYWNCLGKEYRRIIDEHKSGQDVAPAIGSACPSERQIFA